MVAANVILQNINVGPDLISLKDSLEAYKGSHIVGETNFTQTLHTNPNLRHEPTSLSP